MEQADPAMRPDDEQALLALAARAGSDPTLVQGPGGNVSVKHGGVMWIKASGTWLADALRKPILVPVALDPLRDGLRRGDPACDACVAFVRPDLDRNGLRPSIETSVHAVMPQRVVVHVHCVETIAWAARADAETALAPRLRDLPWAFVPYVKPGLVLSRRMQPPAEAGARVVILGNHGLLVGGETVAETEALLAAVVDRLRNPVRVAGPPNHAHLGRLARGTGYAVPDGAAIHRVATDPVSLRAALRGSLYPDHVVFLGPGAIALDDGETVAEAVARSARPSLPLIVVPGAGVLLREGASAATRALAECLSDVTARLDPAATLTTIGPSEEAALLGWDAEKYRQSLDKAAP